MKPMNLGLWRLKMPIFRVAITCKEIYEGEAESKEEAELLASGGHFGDAIERWDVDDIESEEI